MLTGKGIIGFLLAGLAIAFFAVELQPDPQDKGKNGKPDPTVLPAGLEYAPLESAVLRAGIAAYAKGDSAGLERARAILDHILADQRQLETTPCGAGGIAGRQTAQARAVLAALPMAQEEPEIYRYARLHKILNDNDQPLAHCSFDDWHRIENILPGGSLLSPGEIFYGEWSGKLKKDMGADFAAHRAAAFRTVGVGEEDQMAPIRIPGR